MSAIEKLVLKRHTIYGRVISYVWNATGTKTHDISVDKVLEAIRTGGEKLKGQITQIRNRFEAELAITGGDRKAAKRATDALKKQLPAVTWPGRFSHRANDKLIEHSGLLPADLDLLGDRLPEIRQKLQASPYVFAMFISPTGDGLKAIFRVPKDAKKHLASFRAVEEQVRDLTGIQIDQACKDVSRLCFISYDSELYVNEHAIEIEPLPELLRLKPKPGVRTRSDGSKPNKEQIRGMLTVIPKRPDYHDWIKIVAAVGDALDGADAIEVLNEWSKEEQPGEYADKLRHRLAEVHIGTLIHLARAKGWRPQPETPQRVEVQPKGDVEPVELPPPPGPYVSPPLTLLPSQLQEYVHAAAESLNVDTSFILLPKLSSLGAAIGNSRSILLKRDFIQPPIIWTVIIGKTTTLKTPSLEAGCFAVMEHERELMSQNKTADELYAEELSEWESKKKQDRGSEPEKPAFLTCIGDDLTIEALADLLVTNPRGVLVCKDELSHWMASFDQYKKTRGSDVSRWLSLHNGVFLAVDRRTDNRHYRIPDPRVPITGGIQPKVLRRFLTEDFFERGLPARFLPAYPPYRRQKWSEATIPVDVRAAALKIFNQLWLLQPDHDQNGQPQPKSLSLDADAKAKYVDFVNSCGEASAEAGEHEEAAWGKLSGYGARLALIGQLARKPNATTITGGAMQAACELARWFGNEAVRIYAELAETPWQREARELCEFVERRGGTATLRDTITYYWPLKNHSEKAQQMFDQLVKSARGRWEDVKPSGRGRPTQIFRLLHTSASAKIPEIRGKTANCADADVMNSQKIAPSVEPNAEAISGELAAMPTGVLEL